MNKDGIKNGCINSKVFPISFRKYQDIEKAIKSLRKLRRGKNIMASISPMKTSSTEFLIGTYQII